jgi:hypothetical protein
MVKVVPDASLSTKTRPPWASAQPRTSASPRPQPRRSPVCTARAKGLPFHPLAAALAKRFEWLRGDGLISDVELVAAARAFLAATYSTAHFETITHGGPPKGRRGHVAALVEVFWKGFAPARKQR